MNEKQEKLEFVRNSHIRIIKEKYKPLIILHRYVQ
jgi:hypothetical protein